MNRVLLTNGFTSYPSGSGSEKLEVSETGFILIGDERIDIRALHGIETAAQVDALAFMLRYLMQKNSGEDDVDRLERLALAMRGLEKRSNEKEIDVGEMIDELYAQIKKDRIDIVNTGFFVTMNRFLDLPRKMELRAAINRMRRVKWAQTYADI